MIRSGTRWALRGGAVLFACWIAVRLSLGPGCASAWLGTGIGFPVCPVGDPVPSVRLHGTLRRSGSSWVSIRAVALFSLGEEQVAEVPIDRFRYQVRLLDAEGVPVPGVPVFFDTARTRFGFGFTLPKDLPDGRYQLDAQVRTALGPAGFVLGFDLRSPAVQHLITDRPRYAPGERVQYRGLVLSAEQRRPLPGRPAEFVFTDPAGREVLREPARSGPGGVFAGEFGLDPAAAPGDWTITMVDAPGVEYRRSFRVAELRVPRFRIELSPSRSFYLPGQAPAFGGRVVYGSGAPVSGAQVRCRSDAVSAPSTWSQADLTRVAEADVSGAFRVEFPPIETTLALPLDLAFNCSAEDAAHDRVAGSVVLRLRPYPIHAEMVTEFGTGLVMGMRHRAYVRATTSAGAPLAAVELALRRGNAEGGEPERATTDEDGVARFDLEPGPPVAVVEPVAPRPRPMPRPAFALEGLVDVAERVAAPAALVDALERRGADFGACAPLSPARRASELTFAIGPDGRVRAAPADEPAEQCLGRVLESMTFLPSAAGLYRARATLDGTTWPVIRYALDGGPTGAEPLRPELDRAAARARGCFTPGSQAPQGMFFRPIVFELAAGSKTILATPLARSAAVPRVPEVVCVEQKFQGLSLAEPAPRRALFALTPTFEDSARELAVPPVPAVRRAYEFWIDAKTRDGEALGGTRLLVDPGEVPALRLRAWPAFLKPGEKTTVEWIRGPAYQGVLPRSLVLEHNGVTQTVPRPENARSVQIAVPRDAKGWCVLRSGAASTHLYVDGGGRIELELTTDREVYAPREKAKLTLETRTDGHPAPAHVLLIGLDEALSQLDPLPGPDELAALGPAVRIDAPAFAAFDALALEMGRVRGENARAATILRVDEVPATPRREQTIAISGASEHDFARQVRERFAPVLRALRARVRDFDRDAPKDDLLTPETMARLWGEALDQVEREGGNARDGFGVRLELSNLSEAYLSMLDPRYWAPRATRLPEDMEDWVRWVRNNREG